MIFVVGTGGEAKAKKPQSQTCGGRYERGVRVVWSCRYLPGLWFVSVRQWAPLQAKETEEEAMRNSWQVKALDVLLIPFKALLWVLVLVFGRSPRLHKVQTTRGYFIDNCPLGCLHSDGYAEGENQGV